MAGHISPTLVKTFLWQLSQSAVTFLYHDVQEPQRESGIFMWLMVMIVALMYVCMYSMVVMETCSNREVPTVHTGIECMW